MATYLSTWEHGAFGPHHSIPKSFLQSCMSNSRGLVVKGRLAGPDSRLSTWSGLCRAAWLLEGALKAGESWEPRGTEQGGERLYS